MDSFRGEVPIAAVPAVAENDQASSAWVYMQEVLDDALDAVRAARKNTSELAEAVERYKAHVIELEDRCAVLQARVVASQDESECTSEALATLRHENETLVKRCDRAVAELLAYNDAVTRLRGLESRFKAIAETYQRFEQTASEVRAHYGHDADERSRLAEELNFARDVAFERIRAALDGIRTQTGSKRAPESVVR